MATLIEYFRNDFSRMSALSSLENNFQLKVWSRSNTDDNIDAEVIQRINMPIDTDTRIFSYFLPDNKYGVSLVPQVLSNLDIFLSKTPLPTFRQTPDGELFFGNFFMTNSNLIYIYSENEPTKVEQSEIEDFCKQTGKNVIVRSKHYVDNKNKIESPIAFISHDSRDKELIARPLAMVLNSKLCTVWYDEYKLKVGQGLRESIERGIKEAKKCILIITPNFLSNNGWTKKEFDSIFTREMIMDEKIVLPIWHNVSKEEVYEYSPSLAGCYALQWPNKNDINNEDYELEIHRVAIALIQAINSNDKI